MCVGFISPGWVRIRLARLVFDERVSSLFGTEGLITATPPRNQHKIHLLSKTPL